MFTAIQLPHRFQFHLTWCKTSGKHSRDKTVVDVCDLCSKTLTPITTCADQQCYGKMKSEAEDGVLSKKELLSLCKDQVSSYIRMEMLEVKGCEEC